MEKLINTQYRDFILDHVVRPYQNMMLIIPTKRVERLVYHETKCETSFNYFRLKFEARDNDKWFKMVTDRLSQIYSCIDYSFFPKDDFADRLKNELILKGTKHYEFFSQP